jgi:hypothetical protein
MDGKEVDGDKFEEVWDAVVSNEGFEVCYDELFQGCWSVPAIENIGAIGVFLILLEIGFWVYVGRVIYKRRQRKKSLWNKEP